MDKRVILSQELKHHFQPKRQESFWSALGATILFLIILAEIYLIGAMLMPVY